MRSGVKRIYLCSRYAGDTATNVAVSERLCRQVIEAGGAPFAPHLLYPRFLDDRNPSEREISIACGLTFMEVCDEVWVYSGDGLSSGMRREVDHAIRLGKTLVEITEI